MAITLNGTQGTTTPGLYSNAVFTGTFSDGIVVDYTSGMGRISVGSSDGLTVYNGGVASSALLTLDASGNLGIGTSSPNGVRLNVAGGLAVQGGGYPSSGVGLEAYYVASKTYLGSYNRTTNAYDPLYIYSSQTIFDTNGSERARIDSSGNLLVGTTSVSETANVGVKLLPTGNAYLVNTASTGASEGFSMYSTGAAAWRFYCTWAGSIYATSTSITAISDISLKENIRPLETGLAEVLALQPRRFDWKNGDGADIAGFIAQEVIDVLPDLVSDYKYNEEETKKAVKMGDMIPTLVKAIQELTARLEALENK